MSNDEFLKIINDRKEEWDIRWSWVAEVMGVSTKHLSQIVTGNVIGSWENRVLLAETLGLKVDVREITEEDA